MTIELDESQRAAVALVVSARLGVVTGGPGTGKTTSLRVALDELDATPAPNGGRLRVALCAPTGKAARRMQEATGRPASTIHRLLGWGAGGHPGFTFDAENPLPFDVIIADEASMLDIELAAALVDAIDQLVTRLIFVGDVDQLPPVGPGKPFADLIASGRIPVARLTTLHRAAAESWVCSQAPRILRGERVDLRTRKDFRFINAQSSGHVVPGVLKEVLALVDAKLDVQVLSPQHKGAAGVTALNAALQSALNPNAKPGARSWGSKDERLFEGDRVIQTRNDYTLGVMNGEIGAVVVMEDARLVVRFDDRDVEYSRDKAQALHLAYALTTHKAQGSEWPWVVVVVHSTHSMMLTRSLTYTAITRARQGVVIVGDVTGIERAVANAEDAARNTSLVARIGKVA